MLSVLKWKHQRHKEVLVPFFPEGITTALIFFHPQIVSKNDSFESLIVLSLIFKISRIDYLGRTHLFGTSFKIHRYIYMKLKTQRKWNEHYIL